MFYLVNTDDLINKIQNEVEKSNCAIKTIKKKELKNC